MSGTFTLNGTFKLPDRVTPIVGAEFTIFASPYPDTTDHVVYAGGLTVVTDANGQFSQVLTTEPTLFYSIYSPDGLVDPNPFTFAAPTAGTTLWVDGLTAFDPSTVTSTIASAAAASAAAAAASAASIVREAANGVAGLDANGLPIRSVPLWRASTAFASGQTVLAPDGTLISSNSARTSRASFDATEQTFWTVEGPVYNASVSTPGSTFATDTYLVGSSIPLPVSQLQAKTMYRLRFNLTKTAAGVAAPVITIRVGTAGSTADTARLTLTMPAQTAVIDSGRVEVLVTFRTVGSGTSAVLVGNALLLHGLAATGLSVANTGVATAVSGGFDSTVANNIIGASVNGGASAAWTVDLVQAELFNVAA